VTFSDNFIGGVVRNTHNQ